MCYGPVVRMRTCLLVAWAVCALGCGRFFFDSLDSNAVVLQALDGTSVPAGSSTAIAVTFAHGGPGVPGQSVRIATDRGELEGPSGRSSEIELVVDESGKLADIRLHAPLDMRADTLMTLSPVGLEVDGDVAYTVAAPRIIDVPIDNQMVSVADGFTVENVLTDPADRATIAGRDGRLAFPPSTSGFPSSPYLVLTELPPDIHRIVDGSLVFFSKSPGKPDEGVAQVQFADPNGVHGDVLFVCSASNRNDDGVYTVNTEGVWAPWRTFKNCDGMAIDENKVAGNPGYEAPVYLDVNSTILERAKPGGALADKLTATLAEGSNGIKLYINELAPFPTGLYMLYPGSDAPGRDGFIHYVSNTTEGDWGTPEVFAEPLDGPHAAVFTSGTRFGDLLLVAMGATGEIRAFYPDGTSFVFFSGLSGNFDVVLDGANNALWLFEPTRGMVLRIVAL